MRSMKPDKDIAVSTIRIPTADGSIPTLVLSPKAGAQNAAGILWIHGGGYIAGTFVGDGEPFYVETLRYIENLKYAGIPAEVDVYHTDIHAFDMMRPELEISRIAAEKFNQVFAYAKEHYFAENL